MEYINDDANPIPENVIGFFSYDDETNGYIDDVVVSMNGQTKRDWFDPNFYFCLPLVIGNQYGFGIKSMYSFTAMAPSDGGPTVFKFQDDYHPNNAMQNIGDHFNAGLITIANKFLLRTPPGINLMTVQPPNIFIPGLAAMTGVVETDNLRMSFTFNLKITIKDFEVKVNKGDIIAAFLPIQRYSVEKYKIKNLKSIFSKEIIDNEVRELVEFGKVRDANLEDKEKMQRTYFNGFNPNGSKFKDHQKRII